MRVLPNFYISLLVFIFEGKALIHTYLKVQCTGWPLPYESLFIYGDGF